MMGDWILDYGGYALAALLVAALGLVIYAAVFGEESNFDCTKSHIEQMMTPIVVGNNTIYTLADNRVCDQWTRKSNQ